MNASTLKNYLLPILRRRQELQRRRGLAALLLIAAGTGLALFFLQKAWGDFSVVPFLTWAAGTLGCAWLFNQHHRQHDPDVASIVIRIEAAHPELNALLKTAVEQSPDGEATQLNYLQERVIQEAIDHAVAHQWIRLVPSEALDRCGRLVLAGKMACGFALVCLLLPLVNQPGTDPRQLAAQPNPDAAGPQFSVEVTPGNIEVEQGDRLVVLARFEGPVPGECSLLAGATSDTLAPLPMKKNLDDPVFGGIIPAVNQDMVYRVDFDGRQSDTFNIATFTYPKLERADVTITPPSYTGQASEHTADTLYAIAWEGSDVRLDFVLNKPVKSATLVDRQDLGYLLEPAAETPQLYTIQLKAEKSKRFRLQLVDSEGRENRKPPEFVLDVRPNKPPKLKFLFPRQDATVTAIQELPIAGEVSDDLGVKDFGLVYTISGQPKELGFGDQQEAPATTKSLQHLLALEQHGLEPNDLLSYYLWAEDIGPNGKARRVASDMYFAEVRHFEEIFRERQAPPSEGEGEQKSQADELLKLQKQIINATWKVKREAELQGADIAVIKEAQEKAATLAGEAREKVSDEEALGHLEDAIAEMELAIGHLSDAAEYEDDRKLGFALTSEQAAYQSLIKMRGREYEIMKAQSKGKGQQQSQSERPDIQNLKLKQQDRRYETEKEAKQEQEMAQAEQREDLQVLNRLRELSRRQNEIKEKMQELQHALEEAQSEAERAEIRRQLKRLMEEQKDLLRDVDELNQRMNEEQNRERMAEERKELNQSRKDIQQTAEQMEKEDLSSAANTASRAQRKLDELKEDFRKKAAGQFNEEMREMRREARDLANQQEELRDELAGQPGEPKPRERKSLSDESNDAPKTDLQTRIADQQERVEELLDKAGEVSEQAEVAEPLLSRKLYDTVREAHSDGIEQELSRSSDYLRFGRKTEAREATEEAEQGIQELKAGIEQAAETVLGDEAEALKRARAELEGLISELSEEIQQKSGEPAQAGQQETSPQAPPEAPGQTRPSNQPGEQPGQQPGEQPGQQSGEQPGQQPGEQPGQQPGEQSGQQPGQQPGEQPGQQPGEQPGQQSGEQPGEQSGQQPGEQPGQQPGEQPGQQPGEQPGEQSGQQPGEQSGQASGSSPNGGGTQVADFTRGPLTGADFRDWSDRLRDVEEMLDDPQLRQESARIRDRAKSQRAEFKRHSKEPSWELVQSQVLKPLVELNQRVKEALIQMDSEQSLVPIDRDPVPRRFEDLTRRYYDKLGAGD